MERLGSLAKECHPHRSEKGDFQSSLKIMNHTWIHNTALISRSSRVTDQLLISLKSKGTSDQFMFNSN